MAVAVKFASRLNLAISVVSRESFARSKTSKEIGAGRRLRSTRNISCSAPIRATPVSKRSVSIMYSRARRSSSSAFIKTCDFLSSNC